MTKRISWTAGAVLAALIGALSGGAAVAHPHVWIDARSKVLFDGAQRVSALRISWRFDEFYSLFAIEGLDKNGDGTLEAEELRPLADLNITNLKEYRYFTQVTVDGAEATYGEVTDYVSTFEDGILALDFVLPLKDPIDPRLAKVSFKSYDPTFYIAIEPPLKDPVSFAGDPPPLCHVVEVAGESGETLTLFEADFLDPDANQGLGALYATEFVIACQEPEAIQ
ncbi:DUF1007 family protein [Pelagibius sp. CAU 1746]|uniref:DUF1007 family protein n=1 Tax=Pelagibius sp. CAU 1746 TaxID=3140370 RepID=UPI00325B0F67